MSWQPCRFGICDVIVSVNACLIGQSTSLHPSPVVADRFACARARPRTRLEAARVVRGSGSAVGISPSSRSARRQPRRRWRSTPPPSRREARWTRRGRASRPPWPLRNAVAPDDKEGAATATRVGCGRHRGGAVLPRGRAARGPAADNLSDEALSRPRGNFIDHVPLAPFSGTCCTSRRGWSTQSTLAESGTRLAASCCRSTPFIARRCSDSTTARKVCRGPAGLLGAARAACSSSHTFRLVGTRVRVRWRRASRSSARSASSRSRPAAAALSQVRGDQPGRRRLRRPHRLRPVRQRAPRLALRPPVRLRGGRWASRSAAVRASPPQPRRAPFDRRRAVRKSLHRRANPGPRRHGQRAPGRAWPASCSSTPTSRTSPTSARARRARPSARARRRAPRRARHQPPRRRAPRKASCAPAAAQGRRRAGRLAAAATSLGRRGAHTRACRP